MAKTIKELMQKDFWEIDISDHPAKAFEQGYEKGANAVIEEIEKVYSTKGAIGVIELIRELKGQRRTEYGSN